MSEKELGRFYHLKREINDLKRRIEELESTGGVSGIRYKEVDVMSSKSSKSIQEKIAMLVDQLTERRLSALEEYLKIENYINSIDDLVVRQIMKYRFLDLYKWGKIDTYMGYSSGYARLKYCRFKKNKK